MITPDEVFTRNVGVWGNDKQKDLAKKTILIAGVGGLGSFVTQTLVRSGVGNLILVDDGVVDPPDLNRQILYSKEDIGKTKVSVAADKLAEIHGFTKIIPLQQKLSEHSPLPSKFSQEEIDGYVDCLDNYQSRYYLEQIVPADSFLVHGGVQEHYGQVTTIRKNLTPSLFNIYANTKDSEAPMAVCSQAVSCIASIMSFEVLNNIWKQPQLLNSMLIVELSDFTFSKIALS